MSNMFLFCSPFSHIAYYFFFALQVHCNAIKKPENVKAFPAMGGLAAAGTTYRDKMWSKKQSDKRASLARNQPTE